MFYEEVGQSAELSVQGWACWMGKPGCERQYATPSLREVVCCQEVAQRYFCCGLAFLVLCCQESLVQRPAIRNVQNPSKGTNRFFCLSLVFIFFNIDKELFTLTGFTRFLI